VSVLDPESMLDPEKDFVKDFNVEALPSLAGNYNLMILDWQYNKSHCFAKYLTDSQARDTWKIEVYHHGTLQGGTPKYVQATTGYVMINVHNLGGNIDVFCSNSNGTISFSTVLSGAPQGGATIPITCGLLKFF